MSVQSLSIDDDLVRRLRNRAAAEGKSLAALVVDALDEKLAWETIGPETEINAGDELRWPVGEPVARAAGRDLDTVVCLDNGEELTRLDLVGWQVKR